MTPAARLRLGERVRTRRREVGMPVAEAARRADINRMTWDALERGTRALRDANYAGVERTLRWQPGSIVAVLEGGEPAPLPEPDNGQGRPRHEPFLDSETGETYTEDWERALWSLDALPATTRRKLIYFQRAELAREQAERQRQGRVG